jgi:hypothetical protein
MALPDQMHATQQAAFGQTYLKIVAENLVLKGTPEARCKLLSSWSFPARVA